MTIQVGNKMPPGDFMVMGANGPEKVTTDSLFAGKTVVLFALPGAFTPTCNARHLPGFVEHAPALRAKGVDTVACTAVNDIFVMSAWGQSGNVGDDILMLADGSATYAKSLGLDLDLTAAGMGIRSRRYSMVIENGIVTQLNLEPPGEFGVSSAETVLSQL